MNHLQSNDYVTLAISCLLLQGEGARRLLQIRKAPPAVVVIIGTPKPIFLPTTGHTPGMPGDNVTLPVHGKGP